MNSTNDRLIAELAPSGVLRAALNLGNVVLVKDDPDDGPKGVIVDLARELARGLDLDVEFIAYPTAGAVILGLETDRWDVAFLAVEPERAAQVRFTAPYVHIDATYLVRRNSPFTSVADLDREGVKIAVGAGAAYDLVLSRQLKVATLVRAPTSEGAIDLFKANADLQAAGGIRQALADAAGPQSDYRVLADSFSRIDQGMVLPHGRPLAERHVAQFVEAMKANGFVRQALDRHGQQSATVAEPVS